MLQPDQMCALASKITYDFVASMRGRGLNVSYWLLDWSLWEYPDRGFKSGGACIGMYELQH